MEGHDLAKAEEAAVRLRLNDILDSLGPRLFDARPHPGARERGFLDDGLRLEAVIDFFWVTNAHIFI